MDKASTIGPRLDVPGPWLGSGIDPEGWRRFEAEFRKLHEDELALREKRNPDRRILSLVAFGDEGFPFGRWHVYSCISDLNQARFNDLATSLGVALGAPKDTAPVDYWLYNVWTCVRAVAPGLFQPASNEGGYILDILEASAICCANYARALSEYTHACLPGPSKVTEQPLDRPIPLCDDHPLQMQPEACGMFDLQTIWDRNERTLKAAFDTLEKLPGFAEAQAESDAVTGPILQDLRTSPLPALKAIELFDALAKPMVTLVNDSRTRNAYLVVLRDSYYTDAHERLLGFRPARQARRFGGGSGRAKSPQATRALERLNARNRYWVGQAVRNSGCPNLSAEEREVVFADEDTQLVLFPRRLSSPCLK